MKCCVCNRDACVSQIREIDEGTYLGLIKTVSYYCKKHMSKAVEIPDNFGKAKK